MWGPPRLTDCHVAGSGFMEFAGHRPNLPVTRRRGPWRAGHHHRTNATSTSGKTIKQPKASHDHVPDTREIHPGSAGLARDRQALIYVCIPPGCCTQVARHARQCLQRGAGARFELEERVVERHRRGIRHKPALHKVGNEAFMSDSPVSNLTAACCISS